MAFSAKEQKVGAEQLTSDGAVTKHILVDGDGDKPDRGAKITIKYSMRLSDDRNSEPFDSSENRKDRVLRFTLGRNKVIPALEIVTQSMTLGEICEATAAAPYAFGAKGLKRKGVPPNSRIYIKVELLACEGGEKVKSMAQMTPSERYAEAQRCKEAGNNLFKELKYERAMSQYTQCIRFLSNVFYKPPSSSSVAGKPASKPSVQQKEAPSRQPEAGEEGPSEEGFEEAKIIDETQETAKVSAAEGTEVVETIDVSTASQQDRKPTGDVSGAESTNLPSDAAVADSTAPAPQDKSAAGKNEEAKTPPTESEDPAEKDIVALHVTTLNNLSLCLVKLEDYKQAVETASLALRMDPESYKALYYRGRAQIALGEWDKARSDLVSAAKIQPQNIGIKMEIQKLDKKKKQFKEKEKRQAAAMFA